MHHGLDDINSRDLLDEDAYQSNLNQLDWQLAKPIKNKAAIGSLMSETAPNRRKWIIEDNPSIRQVLNKFPPLKDFDMVRF